MIFISKYGSKDYDNIGTSAREVISETLPYIHIYICMYVVMNLTLPISNWDSCNILGLKKCNI